MARSIRGCTQEFIERHVLLSASRFSKDLAQLRTASRVSFSRRPPSLKGCVESVWGRRKIEKRSFTSELLRTETLVIYCNVNLGKLFSSPTKAASGRPAYSPAFYQIKSAIARLLVSVPGQSPVRSSRLGSCVCNR